MAGKEGTPLGLQAGLNLVDTTAITPLTPERINGNFVGKDILSLEQFDPESLETIFRTASQMRDVAKNARPSDVLKGNIVTLLFYEPSSRTRGSFDASTKQLGGATLVVENPQAFSSVSKGESFPDTIRTFEAYSDAIVLRHPTNGAAKDASIAARHVPIINAGDGTGEHPTQAILDLFTIKESTGRLHDLTIVAGGDIKNGRTIHSLLHGLSMYHGNTAYLLAPEELRMPKEEVWVYKQKGLNVVEIEDMREIPKEANAWYWTRVQKERFASVDAYAKVNNRFVVTPEVFNEYANEGTILMHPLPRVGEITEEMDQDSRSVYLGSEVRNGMYTRMALLGLVLGRINPNEASNKGPLIF